MTVDAAAAVNVHIVAAGTKPCLQRIAEKRRRRRRRRSDPVQHRRLRHLRLPSPAVPLKQRGRGPGGGGAEEFFHGFGDWKRAHRRGPCLAAKPGGWADPQEAAVFSRALTRAQQALRTAARIAREAAQSFECELEHFQLAQREVEKEFGLHSDP